MTLALFPSHTFNPYVLPTLIERFITLDGNSDIAGTALDSSKLYLGIVLFKLGLPFGMATCAALIWAVWKSVRDNRLLLIVVILGYYGLMLAVLPLQQPFWLISIYPLLTLTLSALIVQGLSAQSNRRRRLVWAGYVGVAAVWLVIGLFQVYPTFGYYGYELVGDSWLGNNSRGYRGLVVITNDGSTEAIDWLNQNASVGAVVLSYLDDIHIMNYLETNNTFPFEFHHALQHQNGKELQTKLAAADFVIVRMYSEPGSGAPVSDHEFIQQFGADPVFQVSRGRGVYQMPVVQIYQRTASASVQNE
jgi:hypothetical protein